jgi:hypothetical protein
MTLEQKIAQLNGAMQTIDIYARTSATRPTTRRARRRSL